MCYRDDRCTNGKDPHGGLGCNAGGHPKCRFCGPPFPACPQEVQATADVIALDFEVAGTIEDNLEALQKAASALEAMLSQELNCQLPNCSSLFLVLSS